MTSNVMRTAFLTLTLALVSGPALAAKCGNGAGGFNSWKTQFKKEARKKASPKKPSIGPLKVSHMTGASSAWIARTKASNCPLHSSTSAAPLALLVAPAASSNKMPACCAVSKNALAFPVQSSSPSGVWKPALVAIPVA